MTNKILNISLIAAYALLGTPSFAEEINLDPIVVGADFRDKNLSQTTANVTVIGEEKLYDKATVPFAEVVASEPNVNFSSGASKAKHVQIRGMGERGQFETPINPSVGMIIDGVDFSNILLGASLYDVKQVEVLRGPQGTKFGANALAGMIFVENNNPTNDASGHIEVTAGNYNTKAVGLTLNTPLVEDKLLARFSLYKNSSDGFTINEYLGRDDTNNIDELSAKAKFKWFVSDTHTIDLTLMHIDVDNGYDVFNQYNTRTTYSDQPGKDRQKTNAFSLKSIYQINTDFHLESRASYSKSDLEYSYDEDWTDGWNWGGYSSFDQYLRDKEQLDLDFRLVSDEDGKLFNNTTAWTLGTYYKKYSSDLVRNNTFFAGPFSSYYNAESLALYGQFDITLRKNILLITGLRLEQWQTDYSDSEQTAFNDKENLVGGKVGLEYTTDAKQLYYVTLARGYKPGGFNPVTDASGLPKQYNTEVLWNIDAGTNASFLNNQLKSRINLFYGKRDNQQVGTSNVIGYRYTDYITNAEEGTYYGLEASVNYTPRDDLSLYANLGLLKSEFDTFYNPVENVSKDGRSTAQSPEYQYSLGVAYDFMENFRFKTSLDGRGSYYFSNTHDQQSDPYALLNASLEYMSENWTAVVWGRNLTDEAYSARGYYFDNGFSSGESLYTQLGDPRTFGLTFSYDF